MSALPKIYVVVQSQFSSGDVGGCLLLETGEALWGHMSSSLSWLRNDLTTSFTDRRAALTERFPDGYDVVVIGVNEQLPAEVAAANERWAATEVAS